MRTPAVRGLSARLPQVADGGLRHPEPLPRHARLPKAEADARLRKQFASYPAWARTHNSWFVLTFDEDDQTDGNHIPTVMAGAGIKPRRYATRVDHYGLLRTLRDMYGLRPTGLSAGATPVRGVRMSR
jgi:phosphatidylinositol-3-phosphatase